MVHEAETDAALWIAWQLSSY